MKLQELIDDSSLDMTVPQVKAFLLGVLTAEKPMTFHQTVDELLAENPGSKSHLEGELKKLWDELSKNKAKALAGMFEQTAELKEYLESSKEQLDYYLTALSLSGTNVETSDDEDLQGLIEELEDLVMDLDDYTANESGSTEDGEELKAVLAEAWSEYVENRISAQ
jgi:hypothetical protein